MRWRRCRSNSQEVPSTSSIPQGIKRKKGTYIRLLQDFGKIISDLAAAKMIEDLCYRSS